MAERTRHLSLNGRVVPWDEARAHVLTPAFKYGACAFEGIRAYRAADGGDAVFAFRLREHMDRLRFTTKVMRFDACPGEDEVLAALRELMAANGTAGDAHIRLLVWVDGDGEQTATGPVAWAIAALPRGPNPKVAEGVHAAVSSWSRIAENAMPARLKVTANYNNGRLSGLQGRADGYDAVVLLTASGRVAEGPGACLFVVRGGRLVTPSVTDDILESVTRATVLELARDDLRLDAEERAVGRTELYAAEEAFFCGSGQEIQPVLSFDRLPVGDGRPGPVTRALQERYFAAVRGADPARRHWLTTVAGEG